MEMSLLCCCCSFSYPSSYNKYDTESSVDENDLDQQLSECESWISSISITWTFARNSDSQVPPQSQNLCDAWLRAHVLTAPQLSLMMMRKSKVGGESLPQILSKLIFKFSHILFLKRNHKISLLFRGGYSPSKSLVFPGRIKYAAICRGVWMRHSGPNAWSTHTRGRRALSHVHTQ